MEIADVRQFLAATAPFSYLDGSMLLIAAKQISVSYCRRLERFATDVERLMIVRTGHFALQDFRQQNLAQLQPGDCYGYRGLLTGEGDSHTFVCKEDGLLFWLPASVFHACREQNPHFAAYVQGLSRNTLHRFQEPRQAEHVTLRIKDLVGPREVVIPPHATVQQAAQLMTDSRVSSLLVKEDQQLLGIVTDRDLRSRVLAKGLSSSIAISEVMTRKPHTIDKNAYVFEAVQSMSRHNVHHLPVLDGADGYSMVTLSDIMRAQQNQPVYLIGDIHRQTTVEGLVACSERVPALLSQLQQQQVRALEAAHIITTITDALTKTLIQIAEHQQGQAPCRYAWLAFGSQARMDQGLNADQDNALLLERELEGEERDYFALLAEFVCAGLHRCGIRLCPGNIMASNPELRLSLDKWLKRINAMLDQPDPKAILRASIYFDLRCIAGDAALAERLQRHVIVSAKRNQVFLFHLARGALERTPPVGLFNRFILEHKGDPTQPPGVNLKHRGLSLITDVVRVHSLAAGIGEANTLRRLDLLKQFSRMDGGSVDNLKTAFEAIAELRWQHHLRQLRAGLDINNLLDPTALNVLQRNQLRHAFSVIAEAQSAMQQRFCPVL